MPRKYAQIIDFRLFFFQGFLKTKNKQKILMSLNIKKKINPAEFAGKVKAVPLSIA